MRFTHLAFPAVALATLVGCSDPVPPTPQGAWSIALVHSDSECQINSHNTDLGGITVNSRDKLVVDGIDNASVSCSVIGGSSFAVHAAASQEDKSLEILIDKISSSASPDAPASGSVVYSSATTAGEPYQSATACNYYFQPKTDESVKSGKIWVAFNCPKVISGMSSCEISQGYAIFENCVESAEEEE